MPAAIKHLAKLNKLNVSTVLARWADDDRYYAVKVVECDKKARKCRVLFEDGTTCWTPASQLHLQFTAAKLPEASIICCVCDDGKSELPNEIIMCDICEQGYHISCHEPKIDRDAAKLNDENAEWVCVTCNKIFNAVPEPPPKKARKTDNRRSVTLATRLSSSTPQAKVTKIRMAPRPKADDGPAETPTNESEVDKADSVKEEATTSETLIQETVANDETTVVCDTPVEYQPTESEGTSRDLVRDMEPALVRTTQSLLEGGIDALRTEDFAELIADLPPGPSPEENPNRRRTPRLKRPRKTTKTNRNPNDAA